MVLLEDMGWGGPSQLPQVLRELWSLHGVCAHPDPLLPCLAHSHGSYGAFPDAHPGTPRGPGPLDVPRVTHVALCMRGAEGCTRVYSEHVSLGLLEESGVCGWGLEAKGEPSGPVPANAATCWPGWCGPHHGSRSLSGDSGPRWGGFAHICPGNIFVPDVSSLRPRSEVTAQSARPPQCLIRSQELHSPVFPGTRMLVPGSPRCGELSGASGAVDPADPTVSTTKAPDGLSQLGSDSIHPNPIPQPVPPWKPPACSPVHCRYANARCSGAAHLGGDIAGTGCD